MGSLAPAALIAFTRTKIFASVGRPLMVNFVLSIRSVFATIQSSAKTSERKGKEAGTVFSERSHPRPSQTTPT